MARRLLVRTRRTGYALAACAWLAALYNLDDDIFVPHATFGFHFGMFGGELLWPRARSRRS